MQTRLINATDTHFAWMLGEVSAVDGLTMPPDGIDADAILIKLRGIAGKLAAHGQYGSWLITSGSEIVGLCGFKDIPKDGIAEIGYGVTSKYRNLGHATRAVGCIVTKVSADPDIRTLAAETEASNVLSQNVLRRNGFVMIGRRTDPNKNELLVWLRQIRR